MANQSKYQLTQDEKIDQARAKLIHSLRDLENNIYMSYDFFHNDNNGSNNNKYNHTVLKKVHKLGLGEFNQFMSDFVHHYYGGKTINTEHDWYSRDHNDIYGDIADNLVFQYSQYDCEEMNANLVANYYVREPLSKLIQMTAEDDFFADLREQYLKFQEEVTASGF
jgi:hypothetical protein